MTTTLFAALLAIGLSLVGAVSIVYAEHREVALCEQRTRVEQAESLAMLRMSEREVEQTYELFLLVEQNPQTMEYEVRVRDTDEVWFRTWDEELARAVQRSYLQVREDEDG